MPGTPLRSRQIELIRWQPSFFVLGHVSRVLGGSQYFAKFFLDIDDRFSLFELVFELLVFAAELLQFIRERILWSRLPATLLWSEPVQRSFLTLVLPRLQM